MERAKEDAIRSSKKCLMSEFWHSNWDLARARLTDWWAHRGPALCVTSPADRPWQDLPQPTPPSTIEQRWLDPEWRFASDEYRMAHTFFAGTAIPYLETMIGPGSLGLFLGSKPGFDEGTVWYEPWIEDPDSVTSLTFDPDCRWWQPHLDIIDVGMQRAQGRFLVGMPDLIENYDTLAQLRDPMELLFDVIDRPEWVKERIRDINAVYFEAFTRLFERVRDPWAGNVFACFQIWGPGKTAKVQCDALAMLSADHCREFIQPSLREQCQWLDYSMYHLDGTQALPGFPAIMEIEELDAVEWTPQAGIEPGGNERWYPLYRRILEAGKSVQAIGVEPEDVPRMMRELPREGLFMMVQARSEDEAKRLEELVYG